MSPVTLTRAVVVLMISECPLFQAKVHDSGGRVTGGKPRDGGGTAVVRVGTEHLPLAEP